MYVYRLFIAKLVAPYWCPQLGRPLSICSQACATDFITNNIQHSYRSTMIATCVFRGYISLSQLHDTIDQRWVQRRDQYDKIIYPEIQQYIYNFMGFMFWRQDENFQLAEHIMFHDIGVNATNDYSEIFVCNLVESLLSKCFTLKKSPWEVHLVHNYRNSLMCDEAMFMVIIRGHHALGDGPSLLTLLGEVGFGEPVENLNLLIPRQTQFNILSCNSNVISTLLRALCDSGYMIRLLFQQFGTPWLVPDLRKTHRQHLAQTKIIPTETIKHIKNRFGIRFSAVILSCISAAVSKSLNRGRHLDSVQRSTLPLIIPIPVWSRKKTLGIFSTLVFLDLPIDQSLDSVQRLHNCHHLINSAKLSTLPAILTMFPYIYNSGLTPISQFFTRNRIAPIFLTGFPIPDYDGYLHENPLLGLDYCTSGQLGNAGMGFMVPSYKGKTRIIVTCEASIMDKDSLNLLISDLETELQLLENKSGSV